MSSPPTGTVVGGTNIIMNLDRAKAGATAGAAKGLGLALHLMLQASNKRVPWEEGDLSRDGAVVLDEEELLGAVTYGNTEETAAYAERQHEDMTLRHDAGKTAKFLEIARLEVREQSLAILAEQVKQGMGG